MASLKSIDVNSRYEPSQKEVVAPGQLDVIISRVLAATQDYALACVLSFGFVGFFRQSNMLPPSKTASIRRDTSPAPTSAQPMMGSW